MFLFESGDEIVCESLGKGVVFAAQAHSDRLADGRAILECIHSEIDELGAAVVAGAVALDDTADIVDEGFRVAAGCDLVGDADEDLRDVGTEDDLIVGGVGDADGCGEVLDFAGVSYWCEQFFNFTSRS